MSNEAHKRLPQGTHPDLGALAEPLSVAIHAHTRASTPVAGKTVLVMGAGAVGLLCAAVSKAQGARAVVMADIRRDRLDFAVENGFADGVVEVPMGKRPGQDEKFTEGEWRALVAGRMKEAEGVAGLVKGTVVKGVELGEVDFCFEGTGVESSMQTAIYVRVLPFLNIFFPSLLIPLLFPSFLSPFSFQLFFPSPSPARNPS